MKLFFTVIILITLLSCSVGYNVAEHCFSMVDAQSLLQNQCRVDTIASTVGFLLEYLSTASVLPIIFGISLLALIFVSKNNTLCGVQTYSLRLRNALVIMYTSWLRLFGTGVYTGCYR